MSADDLVAGTLLIVGLGLYYVARRRVFNRRNEFGREVFASYSGKLIARAGDAVLLLLALVLGLTGVFLLAFEHPDSWFGIVLIPLGWLVFVGYVPFARRPPK